MNCENCKSEKKTPANVPYIVHEGAMAREERTIKRLWIIVIILIALLFGSNAAWLWYESQFETVETVEEIVIEADGGSDANYIGNDGVIYYGGEDNN